MPQTPQKIAIFLGVEPNTPCINLTNEHLNILRNIDSRGSFNLALDAARKISDDSGRYLETLIYATWDCICLTKAKGNIAASASDLRKLFNEAPKNGCAQYFIGQLLTELDSLS